MTEAMATLIERHGSHGILVDTNILLLLFVGRFDRERIPRFKRTRQFTVADFDRLIRVLSCFARIVTTPNILSEVNSLSGQLGEPYRTKYFAEFARGIDLLDEHYVPSKSAAVMSQFSRLGLTDSVILHLSKERLLVLSDDLRLCQYLEKAGVDVINFSHIRGFS
jgi:rRNA-processing protein FCF1